MDDKVGDKERITQWNSGYDAFGSMHGWIKFLSILANTLLDLLFQTGHFIPAALHLPDMKWYLLDSVCSHLEYDTF